MIRLSPAILPLALLLLATQAPAQAAQAPAALPAAPQASPNTLPQSPRPAPSLTGAPPQDAPTPQLAAPTPPAAPAAQGPLATIQARSNLVLVDVVVTDKNHAPVHNLKITDFQLREGNTPQTIKSFEEHAPSNVKPAPAMPPQPPGVFTNYTPVPEDGPINILLLDRLNTPVKDQSYLHNQLVAYIRSMKPGTRIAIFGLNTQLVLLQGFTGDPALLLSALEGKKNTPRQSALLDTPGSSSTTGALSDLGASATTIANVQQFEAEEQSTLTQLRVRYTLDAMNSLARYLSGLPGRKNLIWFSGSFPLSILPDGDLSDPFSVLADMSDEFRETTDLLTRSQVAVYPVDARGIQSAPMLDGSQSGAKYTRNPTAYAKDSTAFFNKTADEQSTMLQMAHETGGQAFVNTNGLTDAVAHAIDLGSSYYTLAYVPTDLKLDGSFRKIQVTLARQGLELSYRRGYYADNPDGKSHRTQLTTNPAAPPTTPEHPTMRSAMLRGAPDPTQILFKAYVGPAGPPSDDSIAQYNKAAPQAKGPFRKYIVNYAVSPNDLTYRVPEKGRYDAHIEFVVLVYDANGQALNSMIQSVHARLDLEGIKSILKTGLQFQQIVSVPVSGEYFLRIGVHDLNVDRIGAIEVPVATVKNLAVVEPPKPAATPPTLNNLPR